MAKDISVGARRAVHKAIGTSMARTRRGVKKFSSKAVREHYNVKAGQVKKKTLITALNRSTWSFRIIGKEDTINLIHFSSGSAVRQNKRGVSVAVEKGKRSVIRHAFIARDVGGNKRVFTRYDDGAPMPKRLMKSGRSAGKKRTTIRALKGPSVADMFFEVEIDEKIAVDLQQRFSRELSQNLKFFLGKI